MAEIPDKPEMSNGSFYSKFFEVIKQNKTINDEEINIIKSAYPTFAALIRSFKNTNCQSIPELSLSFKLKIHPIASYAIYDFIHVAELGPATQEWRMKCPYDGKCESDLWKLNQTLSMRKLAAKTINFSKFTTSDAQKKQI